MTERAATALRRQRAEAVERRVADLRRLEEIAALRDRLEDAVAGLDTDVGRLRAVVTEVVGDGRAGAATLPPPVPFVVPDAPPVEPAAAPDVRVVVPDAPPAGLRPAPRRRRIRVTVPGVLFTVGALAVADCVVTIAWQEPLSALYGTYQQDRLEGQLADLDRSLADTDLGLSPREEAELRRASAREEAERRMVRLAARYEQRLRPGRPVGELRMGRIGGSLVVVEGTGGAELRKGPGRYETGSIPGMDGTFGIAGHRTSWSAPFRRIDRLRTGDRITMTMPYGRFVYEVTTKRIVEPEDVWVLRSRSRARIVLTACHPLFSARQRIVVSAELRSATPRGAALRRS